MTFLKVCIAEHVVSQLKWDVLIPWPVLHITLYPMNIQRNPHSSLCLEEILSYL